MRWATSASLPDPQHRLRTARVSNARPRQRSQAYEKKYRVSSIAYDSFFEWTNASGCRQDANRSAIRFATWGKGIGQAEVLCCPAGVKHCHVNGDSEKMFPSYVLSPSYMVLVCRFLSSFSVGGQSVPKSTSIQKTCWLKKPPTQCEGGSDRHGRKHRCAPTREQGSPGMRIRVEVLRNYG